MRELVRGYAAACYESAASDGRLADVVADLVGFDRALLDFSNLRDALGSPDTSSLTRRAIVEDLLEDRATPEGVALLGYVAAHEHAEEITLSVAVLVADAEASLAGARGGGPEPAVGRGPVRERIRGYAERVLEELSGPAAIDEVEDELFNIARLLESASELRRVLVDATLPYEGRVAVLDDLLGARAKASTLRLARYVLRAGRLRDLVGAFEWLVDLAAEERGRRVAEVRSAVELDDAEKDRLAVALGRLVGRNVEVRVVHDPSVVGGLLVSVGDLVIDGTVKLRFERLRDLLAQPT